MPKKVSCIIGPPGTGKTVILAAIVYNIYKNYKDAKILVCSNSNYAVDQAALKIAQIKELKDKTVRFITESRENLYDIKKEKDKIFYELTLLNKIQTSDIEESIILKKMIEDFENLNQNEIEDLVKMRKKIEDLILSKCNIICSTIVSSVDQRLSNQRYDYVVIDESSQVKDYDVLIPILKGCKKVVLIGDPSQLGPVYRNDLTIEGPKSMIERLSTINNIRFELVNQYRMHPRILRMPNEIFYGGKM